MNRWPIAGLAVSAEARQIRSLLDAEYLAAQARCVERARDQGIDAALRRDRLDAIRGADLQLRLDAGPRRGISETSRSRSG
jgi:hypothetical protein